MYKIEKKENLNPTVTRMVVQAPFVAKRAKAGQFIILRVREQGERIPLTIADSDPEKGTVTIIFQVVGQTTMLLNEMKEGDLLQDQPDRAGLQGGDPFLFPILHQPEFLPAHRDRDGRGAYPDGIGGPTDRHQGDQAWKAGDEPGGLARFFWRHGDTI